MKKIVVFCLLLLSLAGCAKIVLPTGGPKDTTPPVVTKEVPANRSTLFNSKSIKISFNEFVVLNNPNKTVIVSPPFAEAPELEIVNKSVVIHLPDSLRANTTYSIALAETIKDYTEGNPISIYEYTFSTGNNIDSFMLKGSVTDALSLEKVKDVFVFLYKDDIDSLPLTTRPDHLTKTNGSGQFVFNNIKLPNTTQPRRDIKKSSKLDHVFYDIRGPVLRADRTPRTTQEHVRVLRRQLADHIKRHKERRT